MANPAGVLISAILKALFYLRWLAFAHIRACKQPFDTIVVAPREITLSNWDHQLAAYEAAHPLSENGKFFFGPFMIYVIYFVDTFYILYKHGFNYPTEPMPELLGHKMFPRMFWLNSDVILNVAQCALLVQFYHLWKGDWLDQRYIMYALNEDNTDRKLLLVNRKVWDQQNSQKLFRHQARYQYWQRYIISVSYLVAVMYFNFHFLNRPWFDGLKDWLTYILYYNQMLWYNITGMVLMFFHFFFIVQYIIVKQKLLITKMEKLIKTIREGKGKGKGNLPKLWRKFLLINADLAYECNEIRAYNHFWSIQLSMQFAFSIIIICYSVYCNLFLFKDASIQGLFYFVFFPIEFAFMMFTVIYECSLVDLANKRIYKLNVKACMLFQFHFDNIPSRILARLETIATNRNLSRCCFRLINGYRLDSTAFNMAIYIISTLFIMIVKRNDYYTSAKAPLQQ